MDSAGGWKVLSTAGLDLVFECELRLSNPGFPFPITVHGALEASGASSANALNTILTTLSDRIFTNPMKYC